MTDMTDITTAPHAASTKSQRKAATALWLTSCFDQAAIGLAIVDEHGNHVLLNPAYAQLTGRAKSTLLTCRLHDVVAADSRRLLDVWSQEHHQPTTVEVTIDRPGRGTYDAALFLTPIDNRETRGHTLVQVVGADISPSARDSAARLRAVVDHIDELVLMTRADGMLTYLSPSVEHAVGIQTAALLGTPFVALVHPDDLDTLSTATRTGRTAAIDVSFRLHSPAGWAKYDCRISEVRDQLGGLLGLAYLAHPASPTHSTRPSNSVDPESPATDSPGPRDANGERGAQEDLPTSHNTWPGDASARSPTVTDTSDLIWQFDHEGPVYANPAARNMLGIDANHGLTELGLGDIHPRWAVELIARHGVPQTLAGVVWEDDIAVLDSSGSEVLVSYVLSGHRDSNNIVTHWSSISRPLDRSLRTEAAVRLAVTHDPLTSLPGKVLLIDRIEVALARATRTGQRVGVLLVDLDFFDTFNTSVGADIADRLLVAIAERLRLSIRPGDTVGRMGDDEFVVLCEHFDRLDDAERFAERLLREVEEPITIDGADWFVSMSVGIALARQGVTTPDGLLRNAEAAMYRAKELGRGRHVVFGNMLSTPELPFPGDEQASGGVALQQPELDI